MNPNLKWKALFIFAVILFCIYFLFGYPVFPTSVARMKDNFSKQIKLGLDLQGGTHLILQVQVQEAIAQETDTTVDRLTTLLRSKNIHFDEVGHVGGRRRSERLYLDASSERRRPHSRIDHDAIARDHRAPHQRAWFD